MAPGVPVVLVVAVGLARTTARFLAVAGAARSPTRNVTSDQGSPAD